MMVGATIDKVAICLEWHAPVGMEFAVFGAEDDPVVLKVELRVSADFAEHFIAGGIRLDDLKLMDGGEGIVDGEALDSDILAIDDGDGHETAVHQ